MRLHITPDYYCFFFFLTGKQLWVDLKLNGNQLIWGDGTQFEETPFSQVATVIINAPKLHPRAIRTKPTVLDDRHQLHRYKPLCQANPRGITW